MALGDWLVIETLGAPECWSVLAVGTSPRHWKSLARTVPGQVMPVVAAARATGKPIERMLPKSRHAWSQQSAHAIPVVGPGDYVHAVHLRVGTGPAGLHRHSPAASGPEAAAERHHAGPAAGPHRHSPAASGPEAAAERHHAGPAAGPHRHSPATPAAVAPYRFNSDNRRLEVASEMLGPDFDRGRSTWTGAETFEFVERFDGALDWVATIAQGEPGSRWLGEMTVRSNGGLRTLLTAARNTEGDPRLWRGLLIDITDSVPPQGKSFEAATVDTLVGASPGLHLAVVDTEKVRVLRWISGPIPGLRWSGDTDERTLPHPDDLDRILAARTDILAGKPVHALPGLRLAATDRDWLVVDAEVTPLPYGPPDGQPPRFALVRFELRTG